MALPAMVPAGAHAEELAAAGEAPAAAGAGFGQLCDVLNAYQFKFPLRLSAAGSPLSWVETRKPERYSSAAPLAPDARQRIVSERLDFKNNVVISVSVGPPNRSFLADTEPRDWKALNVARSVLVDKSTARLTPDQRLKEIDIEKVEKAEIDGEVYWYYEYLAQKSPTFTDYAPDVYRHSLAVSAAREGYLYTLNVSTLDSRWRQMEAELREAVESFRLMPVTSDYVPPWKDPWRFW